MITEGIEVIQNVRNRYDGEKANPYDEVEYGRHYARAMASWSAILVFSGFIYDAHSGRVELLPKVMAEPFRCFWSTPNAWGSFICSPSGLLVAPAVGNLKVKELRVGPAFKKAGNRLKVTVGSAHVTHACSEEGDGLLVRFSTALELDSARPLRLMIPHTL